MEQFIYSINELIWSNALILLCLGAGIYFSIRTGFVQVRYFREMLRLLFSGKSSQQGVSSFPIFISQKAGQYTRVFAR